MKEFVFWHQSAPFHTSFASTSGTLAPTPTLSSLPNSNLKPFKLVLSSSKKIAAWFGVTCKDCPMDTIWGCYITKSCWKVVIVALGAIFFFIAFLMSLFFFGQIDNVLKYQRELIEWEKSYPILKKIMISPLKYIHKVVIKTYNNIMQSLTKKLGSKPWFKFVILWPCSCLRGTWIVFQKALQPTCQFCCIATSKVKKCVQDTGLPNFIMKKIGIKVDQIDDAKKKKNLEKKVKKDSKEAKLDARKAKKQAKIETRKAKKNAREDAKKEEIDAKQEPKEEELKTRREVEQEELEAKKEAKQEEVEAKRKAKQEELEAKKEALEAKRKAKQEELKAKLEALEVEKELKQKIKETTLETKEIVKETKRTNIESVANGLNVVESPSPPSSSPPPPSPIPSMAIVPTSLPSTMSMAPPMMSLVPLDNTMASLNMVPMDPLRVFTIPPIIMNQQPMFKDSPQQFSTSPYTDPRQQSPIDLYGTMDQQYPLDPHRILASQYATDTYTGYGLSVEQVQGQVYGAYDNPIYTNEQYGVYNNGPTYEQQGGFGQIEQGNSGQFQDQGNVGQAHQQGMLEQTQYGATTNYVHNSNTTNAQQYYGGGYYNQ